MNLDTTRSNVPRHDKIHCLPQAKTALIYWNVCVAFTAVSAYSTPFATYELWPDDPLWRDLWLFAPFGLLTLFFCFVVGVVQAVLLIRSFLILSPMRFHRLISMGLLILCFALWNFVASCGWMIHV